jgi:hypothetical protein
MREPKAALLAVTEVAPPRIAELPVAQTIRCFFSYRSITLRIAQLRLLALLGRSTRRSRAKPSIRDLLERAETELGTKSTGEWLATYGPWIANIRSAVDWGFSPSGDASISMALTAALVPLWVHLSLMEGLSQPRRTSTRQPRGRIKSRPAPQDEALCSTQPLAEADEGSGVCRYGLDKGARTCGQA